MIDANELINSLKTKYYKKGYNLEDKKEFGIVYDTLDRIGMDKSNFLAQLQSLTIIKENDPNSEISGYNPKTNTINYTKEEDLIHELFHMASLKEGKSDSGIIVIEDDLRSNFGLNEGITDYFTELAKFDAPCSYPFEKLVAESLSLLFGVNVFKGYFNNSYDEFINSFPEEIQIDIIDLLMNLDEYNQLTQSIYSNDFFPEDIESVREITYLVLKSLCDISEYGFQNKDELINLFITRASSNKMQEIKDLINIEDSIEELNNRTL